MAQMKYINLEDLGMVIFEQHVDHDQMKAKFPHWKLISAGFVYLPVKDDCGNEIRCTGKSVSLSSKPNPGDSAHLQHINNPYL